MVSREKALKQLKQLKKHNSKEIRLAAESWDEPWKTLISTIMSARTMDEVTIPVASKLFKKYNSVEKLSKASLNDIKKIIKPVNFYKNKSRNISNCCNVLVEEYNSEIPMDFDKLIELPGVGRKTANVFLSEYGGDNIGLDTHCLYAIEKLKWSKNRKHEKIEQDLKRLFSKNYWRKINPICVRFGKTYTSRKEKNEILDRIMKI